MFKVRYIILVLFLCLFSIGVSISFGDCSDKVSWVRVYISYPEEAKYIISEGLDICSGRAGEYIDVLATPEQVEMLSGKGYTIDILMEDIYDSANYDTRGYDGYHNYLELTADLTQLENDYPVICKLYDFGQGWAELGQIWGVKISDNVEQTEDEPRLMVVGVHHAREPMTTEVVLNDCIQLCDNYVKDPDIYNAINELEIWLIPVMNVDGWIYDDVENHRRWWRKNARDNDNDDEHFGYYDGVDLNRNYSYMWGYDDYGSSPYPEDTTYRGPEPNSEPETQIIVGLADDYEFNVALSYHTYGEYILIPWGYIDDYPDGEDYDTFMEIADGMNEVIYDYQGRYYEVGNPYDTVGYPTNGDFDDYMYGEKGVFGLTFELNTWGQGGFYPPDSYIPETTEMHWLVLKWLLNWMVDKYITDINVLYFKGIAYDGGVKLTWDAESTDEDILGFNIYREEVLNKSGEMRHSRLDSFIKVNDGLITGERPYTYVDRDIVEGEEYRYRLEVVTGERGYDRGEVVVDTGRQTPISLEMVYPNPCIDELSIGLMAGEGTEIEMRVYDISGRKVDAGLIESVNEGYNILKMDVGELANGAYMLVIDSDIGKLTSRFCVVR